MSSARKSAKKNKTVHQRKFEFTCPSNPHEINRLEGFLQIVNTWAKMDDGTMYRLLVSCTEGVNNAILHGNKSDPKKTVSLCCKIMDGHIVVRIKDEGDGFDPKKIPNPLDEQNLLKESGRGVFLMKSLMDKVTFKKCKTGMLIEMKLKLPGA